MARTFRTERLPPGGAATPHAISTFGESTEEVMGERPHLTKLLR